MQVYQPWIVDQAFGDDTADIVTVSNRSHQDALSFLQSVLTDRKGVGQLQGPKGSGKTTIVRQLVEHLPAETPVALVDGKRVKSRELLSRILQQFGFDTGLESNDELLSTMNTFTMRQLHSPETPLLIVENVDQMYPSALSTLNALAQHKVEARFALRIIVTGREDLGSLLDSGGMADVEERSVGSFVIHPMSQKEALTYLHARLAASGIDNAEAVFPADVCDRLYQQSGGWAGSLNRHAAAAMERAQDFPITVDDTRKHKVLELTAAKNSPVLGAAEAAGPLPPRFIVTRDGKKLSDYAFRQKKALIGRSDFADVVIDDHFVSKLHAVMLLYADALVLLDLNSVNGTTVNSVPVSSTVLKKGDVVSLGNHRITVQSAPPISAEMAEFLKTPDTVKMKNLIDMRRVRARRLAVAAMRDQNKG